MASRGTSVKTLGRKADQRAALIRGLARSLILDGSITTTRAKAVTVRPFLEKLATKAKVGNLLHRRRQIIKALHDIDATDKLIERMSESTRAGGYLRIKRGGIRRGDGSSQVTLEFVDQPGSQTAATKPSKLTARLKRGGGASKTDQGTDREKTTAPDAKAAAASKESSKS